MDTKLLILFFVLSIVNVFLQTTKTLVMIRTDNQHVVALTQAIVYAFYTIVIVYSNSDLPLLYKCIACGLANLIGSELCYFVINPIMEKFKKDKLWKIEMTIPAEYCNAVHFDLKEIPHSYLEISNKHTLFIFYCSTQKQSQKVKDITKQYDAKYFVTEQNARL